MRDIYRTVSYKISVPTAFIYADQLECTLKDTHIWNDASAHIHTYTDTNSSLH